MQTISLSKTEQALVINVIEWLAAQKVAAEQAAFEKLTPILEEHELVGKASTFAKLEDGSWVIQIPEETDAAEEGEVSEDDLG